VKWVILLFWYSLFKKKQAEDWGAFAGSFIDQYKMPQGIIIIIIINIYIYFFFAWSITLQSERSRRYAGMFLSTARIPALGNTIIAVETIHFVCCCVTWHCQLYKIMIIENYVGPSCQVPDAALMQKNVH